MLNWGSTIERCEMFKMVVDVNKLQRKFGWLKLPNFMFYVVVITGVSYFADLILRFTSRAIFFSSFLKFDKFLILHGEPWRILSYVFLCPHMHIFLVFLYLYLLNFIGNSLESHWGAFNLTFYYLFGYFLTTCVGFLVGSTTIVFLNLSLILVFVVIYPDINLNLFYFINVRANWLGIVCVLLFMAKLIVSLVVFNLGDLCAEIVALLNFIIFFGVRYFFNLFSKFKQFMNRQRF